MVAVIPEFLEAKAGGSPAVRSSRPAWPTWWNPNSTKIIKISQAWWHAGQLLVGVPETKVSGRWKLQWAKIVPMHSSLDNRARLPLKKKQQQPEKKRSFVYFSIVPAWVKSVVPLPSVGRGEPTLNSRAAGQESQRHLKRPFAQDTSLSSFNQSQRLIHTTGTFPFFRCRNRGSWKRNI